MDSFGGPEVLQVVQEPIGALGDVGEKELLVRVLASGVNPVDTYIRAGTYARKPSLPYTPGSDGAGVVVKAGAAVTKYPAGTRVWLSGSKTGTYSQFAIVSEANAHILPDGLSFEQGAAVNVPYATAYRALFIRGAAKAGETVLVHGASGGVGVAAVQLALHGALHVIGTAGTPEGLQLVLKQGAAAVFDHTSPDYQQQIRDYTGGKGVDVIVEMLADKNLEADIGLLSKGGRVVIVGSRGRIEITPRGLMAVEADVRGLALAHASAAESAQTYAALEAGLSLGYLNPVADGAQPYPLDQTHQAHIDILATRRLGKMVLFPFAASASQ